MKIISRSNKKINPFYFIFFIILVIGKGLNFDSSSIQLRVMTMSALIIGFFGVLRNKYTRTELITIMILMGIGIITAFLGNGVTVLLSIMAIILGKNQDLKKLIRISFWVKLILMVCTIILAVNGRLGNTITYMTRYDNVYARNGFGLGHPNIAQATLFAVIIMFVYSYWEKINWLYAIAIILVDCFFYKNTVSRSGFIIVLFIPLCVMLFKSEKFLKLKKIIINSFTYSYVVLAVLSFAISLSYSVSGLSQILNYYISSRFGCAYYYLTKYPLSIFGHYIENDTLPLDNLYVYTYISFGIAILLLYVIGYTKLMKKFRKENRISELIVCSLVALYGVTENSFINVMMNFTLLFFSELVYKDRNTIN